MIDNISITHPKIKDFGKKVSYPDPFPNLITDSDRIYFADSKPTDTCIECSKPDLEGPASATII